MVRWLKHRNGVREVPGSIRFDITYMISSFISDNEVIYIYIYTVKTVSKFTTFSRFIVVDFQINRFFLLSFHRFIVFW